ncbi:MAG: hypothetical protein GY708_04890 [Actinomycetia bacterium]|nr:hypothetical protein [Actinomycetes bacterium]MCP4962471.1 hypothetical protein [Actinomycetes bacterium]
MTHSPKFPVQGGPFRWRGAAALHDAGADVRPDRLDPNISRLLGDGLRARGAQSAGVRLSARTDAASLSLTLGCSPPSEGPPPTLAATVNGRVAYVGEAFGNVRVDLQKALGSSRPADVDLWLPHNCSTALSGSIVCPDGSQTTADDRDLFRWTVYGSSITQAVHASSPVSGWASRVALERNWDLTNLGFASEAMLDPLVARQIAATATDLVTVCAGINPHTAGSMSSGVFRSLLAGFITTIRDGHPTIPIVVVSPIICPDREDSPSQPRALPTMGRRALARMPWANSRNLVGPTLASLRADVHDVVDALNETDQALTAIDGTRLLGRADAAHLGDGLHPDDDGHRLMAERFLDLVADPR